MSASKRARRVVALRGIDVHDAPQLAGGYNADCVLPDRIEQMVVAGAGDQLRAFASSRRRRVSSAFNAKGFST